MLSVQELTNQSYHSVSLTMDSTVAQIVATIRRSTSTRARLYVSWKWQGDATTRARRLRGEDKPLHVVSLLQRACESPDVRLILANVDEEPSFALHELKLETGESELFSLIERMGKGDVCAYLKTSIDGSPAVKKWWVLAGDRLWYTASSLDDFSAACVVPLAHGVVHGPGADAAMEMHSALHTYRLFAASKNDATAWALALKSRVQTATDNDLVAVADLIIADEERAASRAQFALIERATSSFEALVDNAAGARLLAKFARRLGTQLEGLLWFYLDNRHVDLTGDVVGALQRFCDLRGPALAELKAEIRHVSSPSLALLSRVLIETRSLLVEQLYDKFVANDLAVAELPLASILER